ncbi:MAG: discoidin domain-containing protein, partial [Planctomycetota bacterium]
LLLHPERSGSPSLPRVSNPFPAEWEETLATLERRLVALEGRLGAPSPPENGDPKEPEPSSSEKTDPTVSIAQELSALRNELSDMRLRIKASRYGVETRRSSPNAPSWSVEQALGPPDTATAGDHATAWASLQPDAGAEWLEVDFDETVVPDSVLIRETYNPGAVTEIEVMAPGGQFRRIWSGSDPTEQAPGDFIVDYPFSFAARTVRVHLDTTRVKGWNEIDAIGLIVADRMVWAEAGNASSTYANR